MKRSLFLIATLCTLLFATQSNAQTDATDVNKSLDMARNILKAATGLANDFADFKGDFLQKDDSGNSYYTTKDLDVGTSSQYVVMRANGSGTFAAIYKPKDNDDKTPVLAFAAFTGGVSTLNSDISTEEDAAASQGTTLKFYLKAKGIKIASFTFDTGTKSGTLLVAIQ